MGFLYVFACKMDRDHTLFHRSVPKLWERNVGVPGRWTRALISISKQLHSTHIVGVQALGQCAGSFTCIKPHGEELSWSRLLGSERVLKLILNCVDQNTRNNTSTTGTQTNEMLRVLPLIIDKREWAMDMSDGICCCPVKNVGGTEYRLISKVIIFIAQNHQPL